MKPPRFCLARAALLAFLAAATAGAQTHDDVMSAAKAVVSGDEIQTVLPSETRAPESSAEPRVEVLPNRPPAEQTTLGASDAWGTLLQLLAWMCAIAAAIVVALWVLELMPGRGKPLFGANAGDGDIDSAADTAKTTEQGLSDADQLAASGRYGEAMHRLLLDAVRTLARRSKRPISDSQTSREILRDVPAGSSQHRVLREIVQRVEATWFGRQRAAAADYAAVRALFDEFRAIYASDTR